LGFDFYGALRGTVDRSAVEGQGTPKNPIIESLDTVLSDLSDAMAIRHILSHEVAQFQRVPEQDASRFLKSGEQFTNAVSWLISETLHPGAPLTQTDMTIEAGRRAAAEREAMQRAIASVAEALDEEDKALLARSQEAWEEYSRAFCLLEANAAKGGSMSPMLRNSCSERMAKERRRELEESLRGNGGLAGQPRRVRRPR
jgi:uncharacterized protein YecT (DUF1311 family)